MFFGSCVVIGGYVHSQDRYQNITEDKKNRAVILFRGGYLRLRVSAPYMLSSGCVGLLSPGWPPHI